MNEKRMMDEFIKLASFNSESFHEKEISLYLYDKLKSLGLYVTFDNASEKLKEYQEEANNIYGFLKGNIEGEPILFSAHMDTVSPGINKKVIVEGNLVHSDHTSVLGADDLTGVVCILDMLEQIKENHLPHPDIEILFFVAEEPFGMGSKVYDYSNVKSKIAYVLDLSGPVGSIALASPSMISFSIEVLGHAAHAGFEPENGVSAIQIASNAISKLKLGRIDENTTANIGIIHAGSVKNAIPANAHIDGEVRSMDHRSALSYMNHIKDTFIESSKLYGGEIVFTYEENICSYKISKESKAVKHFESVYNELGFGEVNYIKTMGGSDQNNMAKVGIEGVVMAQGMNKVHSVFEYFMIDEFVKAAKITLALATSPIKK